MIGIGHGHLGHLGRPAGSAPDHYSTLPDPKKLPWSQGPNLLATLLILLSMICIFTSCLIALITFIFKKVKIKSGTVFFFKKVPLMSHCGSTFFSVYMLSVIILLSMICIFTSCLITLITFIYKKVKIKSGTVFFPNSSTDEPLWLYFFQCVYVMSKDFREYDTIRRIQLFIQNKIYPSSLLVVDPKQD